MDSRLVIRQVKTLTANIAEKTLSHDQIYRNIASICENLTNPYILCLSKLISVAQSANIDVSMINNRIKELKS